MPLAALAALGLAAAADASTFQVNPVVLEAPAGAHTAILTIRNSELQPVSVQLRLFRWTQRDGADVYEPTDTLIASPPVATIAGAGSQLVRVGPRAGQLSGAYLVIIEEILPPAVNTGAVRIALRLNLPLYVMPRLGAKAMLRWSGWRDATGHVVLQAQNDGARYQTVVGISAATPGQKGVRLTTHFGAVLPGGSKRWDVGPHPELAGGSALELLVEGSDGVVTRSPVTLAPR
ncbi:fimbrial biogenesis chaperone [Sphingomonas sp. PAMC 26605]|uniref:fimbrial biogenesis chaperone n=1 Tax=Sphingomonas sp. PAMC 26605 TaxID=1112214 RepID=UPI000318ED34|nr:fimbria/pilus periplasmic chaperone [Sphingomonas sp. PAMC 26605]